MNNVPVVKEHPQHRPSVSFSSGVNLVAAIWLLISPWTVGYSSVAVLWNDAIVGAVVLVLMLVRLLKHSPSAAPSWLNSVLGVWLIVSPFVFSDISSGQKWNCVLVGLLFALASVISGTAESTRTS